MPILASLGLDNSINLLRTSFNSDHTGMDAVMDVLKVSVDETTKIATITNVINASSITQDIVTNSITGTLDNTGVVGGLPPFSRSTMHSRRWRTCLRPACPLPPRSAPSGCSTTRIFCLTGKTYDEFMTDITTNAPVGLKFSNITIVSAGTDNMVIGFTVLVGSRPDSAEQWLFKKDATTGTYRACGNQRNVSARVTAKAEYEPGAPSPQIRTGLVADIQDPHLFLSANGVVVITGPGRRKRNVC